MFPDYEPPEELRAALSQAAIAVAGIDPATRRISVAVESGWDYPASFPFTADFRVKFDKATVKIVLEKFLETFDRADDSGVPIKIAAVAQTIAKTTFIKTPAEMIAIRWKTFFAK